MQKRSKLIYKLTIIAMCIAIITLCAWISLPFTVGFTLQIFAIFLISGCFTLDISLSSVALYLLLGMIGVPIFSGFNTGISALMSTSGGFLVGFLLSVPIISLFKRYYATRSFIYIVTMIISLLVCYAFGCIWYMNLYSASFVSALGICVIPFLIPDAIKIFLVVVVFKKLDPYIKRLPI